MTNLISLVADMTSQCDRDALEITVAKVLFELLDARRIESWKVVEHRSGTRVRLLAGVRSGQAAMATDPAMNAEDCPLLDYMNGLRECVRSGAPSSLELAGDAAHRHFLPLYAQRERCAALEVELSRPMSAQDRQLIDGLMRIYPGTTDGAPY
jgi:hypothetical protein